MPLPTADKLAKMRVAVFHCLLILFTLQAQAAPADTDPVSWPDQGPYQRVGQAGYGAGSIEMPRQVVAVVRRRVQGDPSSWYLVERYGSPGREERTVCVAGRQAEMCLLVARGTWTSLNASANLPSVNTMLGSLATADLQDRRKLRIYLSHVVRLQRCLDAVFLDPAFRLEELDGERIHEWLQGTEKNPHALLALCREWVMTKTEDGVAISCNVMNGRGGVERWVFHLRVDRAGWLESLDVRQLCEDGTFYSRSGNVINLLRI